MGYVEGLNAARTLLAGFFSILLRAGFGLELLDHAVQAVLMQGGHRQKF